MNPNEPAYGKSAYATGASGNRIHYMRTGTGPPVLLLHGWPGYWYDWRHVIPLLSSQFDLVIPDLRGFGRSDKPAFQSADYGTSALAADLGALLNELQISSTMVLGYDIGGSAGQALAREYPNKVKGLVISNPTYPGVNGRELSPDNVSEFWYVNFNVLPLASELVGYHRDTVSMFLRHFYDHWSGPRYEIESEAMESLVDTYASKEAIEGSLHYYKAWAASLTRNDQSATRDSPIDQPTIVLWGDSDPTAPIHWSDNLDKHFSNLIRLEPLQGIGHFVPLEAPQAFAIAAIDLDKEMTDLTRLADEGTVENRGD